MTEPQFAGPLHALRAEARLWQGDADGALAAVRAGLAAVADGENDLQVLRLGSLGLRAVADLAERRRALPDRPRHHGLADAADLDRATARVRASLPAAAALRDLCDAERGRRDGTATSGVWAAVAAGWDAFPQPYPAAYARWRAAEAAVGAGDRGGASAALRLARPAAAALGAVPLLAEIDALAVAARLDVAEAGQRAERRAEPAPFGLTPREREVLGLLCEGLTNRQIARSIFVAERTAGVHVSNIIAKMQVANRSQAAALARRTGLSPDRVM